MPDIHGAAKAFWFLVLDVQHRAHLVSIPGLEPAIVEAYVAGKLGVDEAETFLLSAAHEIRTEDLEIIYVNEVLIVVATTDGVL